MIEKSILPFLSTILFSTRALKPNRPEDLSTISDSPKQPIFDFGKYLKDF